MSPEPSPGRLAGGKTAVTTGEVWAGGEDRYAPAQQYTGGAYANPVIFRAIYRPRVEVKHPERWSFHPLLRDSLTALVDRQRLVCYTEQNSAMGFA